MFCLKMLRRLYRSEDGVTAIEYGLISALVAVVIIVAVSMVGTALTRTFDTVAGAFPSSASAETDPAETDPAETDPNKFPDPCQEGGTNCGDND